MSLSRIWFAGVLLTLAVVFGLDAVGSVEATVLFGGGEVKH